MKKQLKNKKIAIIAVIAAIVVALGLGGFLFYTQNLKSVTTTSEKVPFEIKNGEGMSVIAANLKEKDLIRNTTITKLYAKLNGLQDVKAGNFMLDKSWSTKEILTVLNDANKAKGDEVMITFREGMWAKDMR